MASVFLSQRNQLLIDPTIEQARGDDVRLSGEIHAEGFCVGDSDGIDLEVKVPDVGLFVFAKGILVKFEAF